MTTSCSKSAETYISVNWLQSGSLGGDILNEAVQLNYQLKRFDAHTLSNTKSSWKRQIEIHKDDIFAAPFERILTWAEGHCVYDGDREDFAYGLFYKEEKHADAILEVCYTKSGTKWLKLLDLTLSPELERGFADQDIDLLRITHLFAVSITGLAGLTASHPAKIVKLFARSGTLLAFYKGIGAYIEAQGQGNPVRATIEGRWLVFKPR